MFVSTSSQIENEFIRSYFGSWIDQIDPILDDNKNILKYHKKENWERELQAKYPGWSWAGSGGFRWVLSPNDSYVVKFAHSGSGHSGGVKTNQLESERQLEFEGFFPKVFFHHPNWEWIVVEKVKPAMPSDLADTFGISKDGAFAFGKLLSYYVSLIKGNDKTAKIRFEEAGMDKSSFDKDYQTLLSNPVFRRLADIAIKLDLWEYDLSWGNLGINKSGKLVILDSSFSI
jgi:hypothetical protein